MLLSLSVRNVTITISKECYCQWGMFCFVHLSVGNVTVSEECSYHSERKVAVIVSEECYCE